jgi:hypothetical protein
VNLSKSCFFEREEKMANSGSNDEKFPADLIDERIAALNDWRAKMLSRLPALIKQAEPEVLEEWTWRGVPVWYCHGMICTGETGRPGR